MWKLTIFQKKKHSAWESEDCVSVLNDDITVLSDLMEQMASCKPETEIRFELARTEEPREESRFINPKLEEVPVKKPTDELF